MARLLHSGERRTLPYYPCRVWGDTNSSLEQWTTSSRWSLLPSVNSCNHPDLAGVQLASPWTTRNRGNNFEGIVNLIQLRAYRVHLAAPKLLIVRFNTDWFRPKNETIFLQVDNTGNKPFHS